ncbi:hypothetical protein N9J56_01005 [Pelagibacteraceae bacterium]|nr:hypothetical protein [Pelagibacteraceae bacterium]
MKKLPICAECGESDTMLTQVSNFNDVKFLCSECHQLKYQEENSNKILNYAEVDSICEECKKEDENVKSNLIMYGYKVCNSCKTSKTIFPI